MGGGDRWNGTLIMVRAQGSTRGDISIWIYLLPILAAFFYATMQVLTRKLAKTKASAMAFYIQITFVLFCDQRFNRWKWSIDSGSLVFLLVGLSQQQRICRILFFWHSCDRGWILPIPSLSQCWRQFRLNMSYCPCPLYGAG